VTADITWEVSRLSRERRWASLGQHGAAVWFTGLPASGKSTVAGAVETALVELGRSAYRLDGDNLRHGVCGDLGFSPEARDENVRRAGEIAHLFADAGTVALVSLISPYADGRQAAREMLEADGLTFVEVFVNTPVEECARRDPKGLYARAAAGELTGLTGVDAPYEAPVAPDVELTPELSLPRAVELVLEALR
jgi:adenylyl-sulfate kinase